MRLYLDVRDDTGNIVKELSANMFYVSERNAQTGNFQNYTVKKAIQMNENEKLNMNLLVDTSSSMANDKMDSAKDIIKNFLATVQFPVGDKVRLTPFNCMIDKTGYFTDSLDTLHRSIESYQPTGQTKLYNTIIYGVQDISGQDV